MVTINGMEMVLWAEIAMYGVSAMQWLIRPDRGKRNTTTFTGI